MSKRRKKPEKTRFRIMVSDYTGKYLICIVHKGETRVISPHVKIEDAKHGIEMCKKCLESFSKYELEFPLSKWFKTFINRINSDFYYDDDDEVLGVIRGVGPDGSVVLDISRDAINKATAEANMAFIQKTGRRLYTYSRHGGDDVCPND